MHLNQHPMKLAISVINGFGIIYVIPYKHGTKMVPGFSASGEPKSIYFRPR